MRKNAKLVFCVLGTHVVVRKTQFSTYFFLSFVFSVVCAAHFSRWRTFSLVFSIFRAYFVVEAVATTIDSMNCCAAKWYLVVPPTTENSKIPFVGSRHVGILWILFSQPRNRACTKPKSLGQEVKMKLKKRSRPTTASVCSVLRTRDTRIFLFER